MNSEDITTKLTKWMTDFVEIPNSKLGNWPPCPYARQARVNNQIKVMFSEVEDLQASIGISLDFLSTYEVVVICFDHTKIGPVELQEQVSKNNELLLSKNYVILEDHPESPEYINGVNMNFGECGLLVVQHLDKLNKASDQLREKGYYTHWSQEDLDTVVTWRHK